MKVHSRGTMNYDQLTLLNIMNDTMLDMMYHVHIAFHCQQPQNPPTKGNAANPQTNCSPSPAVEEEKSEIDYGNDAEMDDLDLDSVAGKSSNNNNNGKW